MPSWLIGIGAQCRGPVTTALKRFKAMNWGWGMSSVVGMTYSDLHPTLNSQLSLLIHPTESVFQSPNSCCCVMSAGFPLTTPLNTMHQWWKVTWIHVVRIINTSPSLGSPPKVTPKATEVSPVEICLHCPVSMSPWKGLTGSTGSQSVPMKSSSQMPWELLSPWCSSKSLWSEAVSPCGEHHAALHSHSNTQELCCRVSHVRLCVDTSCSHSCRAPGAVTAVGKGRTDISKNLWAFTAWPHTESTKKRHLTRRCLWRSVKFLFVRSTICSRDNYQLFIFPLVLAPHKWMGRSQSTYMPASLDPLELAFHLNGERFTPALLGLWRSGILHHSKLPLAERRWILKRLGFESKLWLIDITSETTLYRVDSFYSMAWESHLTSNLWTGQRVASLCSSCYVWHICQRHFSLLLWWQLVH